MHSEIRVLIVDDDLKMQGILAKHFQRVGYEVAVAASGAEALARVEEGPRPDVVLTDVRMPGLDGRSLLAELGQRLPEVRVILMTGFGAIADAVDAMRAGAFWYLAKPFSVEEAALVLRRAATEVQLSRRIERLERSLRGENGPERYLGRSERARSVRRDLMRAGELRCPVLLLGPTGTGKDLAARIVHGSSARAAGPFVPVNCAAIPGNLFESELFGYRRGAFTGAHQDCAGLSEEADGGTLFLDEVGELPASQQPKLLRLLEGGELRRVGDRAARHVDVRVIAATNRPLEERVRAGEFRADLYYRLAALVVEMPALAARAEDIPILAEALLVDCARAAGIRAKGFTSEALERLSSYPWPGNVRELRNAIEQALFRASGPVIDEADLPGWVRQAPERRAAPLVAGGEEPQGTLDDVERGYILQVLTSTGWNRSRAAQILGIDRRTLFTRIQRYGLVLPSE